MDPKVRDLIEKVKASAITAAESAGKVADSAAKKAGEFVETAKLNLKVFDLNTDIELGYKEIGKNVYMTHIGAEIDAESIETKLAELDEKFAKIDLLKAELAARKSTITCPGCGKECGKNDEYCSACGTSLS